MGTHISKVKSVNLDSWTEEQVESIKSKGNDYVNNLYNPNPQRHPLPSVNDDQYATRTITPRRPGHKEN